MPITSDKWNEIKINAMRYNIAIIVIFALFGRGFLRFGVVWCVWRNLVNLLYFIDWYFWNTLAFLRFNGPSDHNECNNEAQLNKLWNISFWSIGFIVTGYFNIFLFCIIIYSLGYKQLLMRWILIWCLMINLWIWKREHEL